MGAYFKMKKENKEIEYVRDTFNLDKNQLSRIEQHVFNLANQGVKVFDGKLGRNKKISKSSWARLVFEEALEKGTPSEKPKNTEILKNLEDKYGEDVVEECLKNLENIMRVVKS
jgi:hypothetical protein